MGSEMCIRDRSTAPLAARPATQPPAPAPRPAPPVARAAPPVALVPPVSTTLSAPLPAPVALPLAPPIALPVRATSSDVSMSTDTSTYAPGAASVADTSRSPDELVSPSRLSSRSGQSEDSELLAELEMDLDPAGIVTLTLEHDIVEQRLSLIHI